MLGRSLVEAGVGDEQSAGPGSGKTWTFLNTPLVLFVLGGALGLIGSAFAAQNSCVQAANGLIKDRAELMDEITRRHRYVFNLVATTSDPTKLRKGFANIPATNFTGVSLRTLAMRLQEIDERTSATPVSIPEPLAALKPDRYWVDHGHYKPLFDDILDGVFPEEGAKAYPDVFKEYAAEHAKILNFQERLAGHIKIEPSCTPVKAASEYVFGNKPQIIAIGPYPPKIN
ncbi:hypothetical protein C7G42_11700 [Bradyrhizobium sp. MOS003]|jgi:hypothetical protein|nr:hypothetical protein C7G42_11700 [Bradyrhizobium sp. MOS003]